MEVPSWSYLNRIIFGSHDGADVDVAITISKEDFLRKPHQGALLVKQFEKYLGVQQNYNATLIVIQTLKGTVDEVNNSLYYTQCVIGNIRVERTVERDVNTALLRNVSGYLKRS